ncbi:polysaccharide biosynthesis/export family protein [bacterium]|nr:polysaccharide biosynthesis/export family protein [bacterium]
MRVTIGRWRRAVWLGLVALAAAPGCMHTSHPGAFPGPDGAGGAPGRTAIAVPPQGAVPTELAKVTLPPYVIESPDVLIIQVVQRAKVPVVIDGVVQKDPTNPNKNLEQDGTKALPVQDISGQFALRPDGTVGLGFWGSVTVAGLTLDQAVEAIKQHLLRSEALKGGQIQPQNLVVVVDVLAYNSKRYYVVTDGGGYGEQVFPFPVTGSETVMDGIANINGLPAVASRRNIWVARRCPHPNQPWQILPVDWVGITQHGLTETNYQIMPGDRIYVKAQRLVTIDTALARVISPIERIFGVTLLGASTVNQVQGRNTNNNNSGFGF